MTDYELTLTGDSGSPVLLLPGGAAASRHFFPGLVEALAGHRVLELDRPGTGRALGRGTATLATGAAAAAQALRVLDAGPAVVVGQSLGGAVALQLAADFPELVSGLVLVDPTPLDQPGQLRTARALFKVLALPGRAPVVGAWLERALWRALMGHRNSVAPGTELAVEAMMAVSFEATARAIAGFEAEGAALLPRLGRLAGPAVLLTADRKADHAVRRSHVELAGRLGARLETWPGAVHAEHLRRPAQVNALVLQVLAEVDRVQA